MLHVREESPWSGVSVPVHEKPNDPDAQPVTVASRAQVTDAVNGTQQ
jgi:hypothetical protein